MVDFIVNLFAEIADFFITFWVDNVIDKFAKRNKKIPICRIDSLIRKNHSLPARYTQSVTSEMVRTLCFFRYVVFVTAIEPEAIKQTQSTAKCAYPSGRFSCTILAKTDICA